MPISVILSIIISLIAININIMRYSAATRMIFSSSAQTAAGKVLGVSEIMPARHLEPVQNKPAEKKPWAISGREELQIFATSSAAVDCESGKVLFNKNKGQVWPIASITKLATALVFVENNPGWETEYQMKAEDRREGGKIYLFTGEKMKVKDLFYFSLVGSDNTATIALARSTGLTDDEFVVKMNAKAEELGLNNTFFADPVGLDSSNVSTAEEIAKLAQAALAVHEISEATLTKKYEFNTDGGRHKAINNTDALLDIFPQNGIIILGGKTGYIDASGFCFAGKFANHDGKEIISVVLGTDSYNARFEQTKRLVDWVYGNYQW